jgi:dephospho-CoA kinase
MQNKRFRLGLTGGIGSGKSTAANFLVEMGASLIDADAISRSLTATCGAALPQIAQAFGTAAIGPDGAMDRAFVRSRVFADPQAKLQLEAIIHPLVRQATEQALANATGTWVVHDIPLLVESGRWRAALDAVLVIDCLETTQIERVMARSGLSPAEVQAVMANQASRTQRLAAADMVVFNDGISLQQLKQELQHVVGQIAPSQPL